MNSRERILTAAKGGKADFLPVAPYMGNHGIHAAGMRIDKCYRDGKKLAEAQFKAWEIYQQDAVVVQSDNYYMAEAFGCKIAHHEDSTPTLEQPALATLSEAVKLKKPDPLKDGRMNVYLEGIETLRSLVGDEVAIRGCGTGPFVMAGHLLGTEKFIMELANAHYGISKDVEALHAILDITCETLIDFVTQQIRLGATVVQLADSLASIDMISPEMYEVYALPYEIKFYKAIKPLCEKHGCVSLLHICGDNTKVFHLFAETGADIIAIDHKSDLSDAKRIIGSRACLIGNIDPANTLLFGDTSEVEKAARLCIDKAADGGGFILGTGCEVAVHTPIDNIKAMIRLAREYIY
jgi:uroporphyrinogen decarboxylase